MYELENPPNYERFHLRGNPFTQLSSEGIEDFEDLHVSQDIDSKIAEALSNVLISGAGIVLCVIGNLGTGKTQRLRGIKKLIEDQNGFGVYVKVDSSDVLKVTRDLFENLEVEGEKGFLGKILNVFSSPKKPLEDLSISNYDSSELGKKLKENFEMFKTSALLIDELENLSEAPEEELILFFEMLREFISDMPESCIFSLALTEKGYEELNSKFPAFLSRFHYKMRSEQLTQDKAQELVKKRLNVERISEVINPLYPFNESAINLACDMAKGNPRYLLRILHIVLTSASREKLIDLIDDRFVSSVVKAPTSVDEYIARVPHDLRDIVSNITKKHRGGPVSYVQLSKEMRTSPTIMYTSLEELVGMGILDEVRGKYEITERMKAILMEEEKKRRGMEV